MHTNFFVIAAVCQIAKLTEIKNILKPIIKERIKQKYGYIDLLNCTHENWKLAQIYTDVSLVRVDRSGNKCNECVSLMELPLTGAFPTRTVLQGDAGIGKSTMIRKKALDWAEDNNESPLSRFELLFPELLRFMKRQTNDLLELVRQTDIIPSDVLTDYEWKLLKQYVNSNPDIVCFLLDGYDQLQGDY